MRNGYIICELAHNAAHIVLARSGLPPPTVKTTDWTIIPATKKLRPVDDAIHFLLRVPGDAKGLWRALEGMMDAVSVHREGYPGLENVRLLLTAVTNVRCGAADRVRVNFTLSPEQQRLNELEFFQCEEAVAWSAHQRCLEDPGCAEVLRRGR